MYWKADNEQFLTKQQLEAFHLHVIYKQTFSNFALKMGIHPSKSREVAV